MIIRCLIIILFLIMNVMSEVTPTPENKKLSGDDFSLTWTFQYKKDGEEKYLHALDLSNMGKEALEGQEWALYFNLIHRIRPESITPDLKIERINGHFYKITPGKRFSSLMPGKILRISFETQIPTIKESDIPSGFYMVFNDGDGHVSVPQRISPVHQGAEITADQTIRAPNDNTPVTTAKSRYNENSKLSILPPAGISKIIPRPVRFFVGESSWTLNTNASIHFQNGLENEAEILTSHLEKFLGKRIPIIKSSDGGNQEIVLKISDIEVDDILRTSGDEAYLLSINTEKGVEITGTDEAGVFYGIQSLCALIPINALGKISDQIILEEIVVEDAPRYAYRGMHLDVARNFQSKESVLKFLDLIAFYKLNRFHFHLTDDEGWRLEIKSLPELTEVGGQRGHTIDEKDRLIPSFGSGPNNNRIRAFYSQDEFIEILEFATERHIQVIPEIDIPGHARAAIKSMEARYHKFIAQGKANEASAYRLVDPEDQSVYKSAQNFDDNVINICIPSTYRFLETVIDEVIDMYQKAHAPLSMIHIGGDEVPGGTWLKSPSCENLISEKKEIADNKNLPDYFLQKVSEIIEKRGLSVAGWEEIALIDNSESKIPNEKYIKRQFVPYVWNNVWGWGAEDIGYRLANSGYKVILCNATNLYFDCAYNKDPKEPGLYWAGFVDTRKAFEFTPDDIFMNTHEDRLGNEIDFQNDKDKIRLTNEGQKNILGIQGQLWGERLVNSTRLDYMAFPKIIGLAERAWAKKPEWAMIHDKDLRKLKFQTDWNAFVNSIGQREMVRLDYFYKGVAYRIPPPGAVIEDGMLKANSAYPGLEIRFTRDGSDPTEKAELYQFPVKVSGNVKLRSFNSNGRGSRIAKTSGY